jgi:hypothetical protein
MDEVKAAGGAAAKAMADAAKETIAAVGEKIGVTPPAAALPEDRESLLALHREARRRRDAAPLLSKDRAEAAYEIERIEIQVARVERAMDPPLV